MPRHAPLDDEPTPGLSRRSLLRGAAWAAPVIVVAAAAPAASASGGDIVIVFDNFTVVKVWGDWPNNWGGVDGNLQIDRRAAASNLTQLTVQITFESRLGLTSVKENVNLSGSGAGWSIQSVSVGATYTVYTFLWVGNIPSWENTGKLNYAIPTTITATMDSIGTFSATGFANSPQVAAGITASATV